MSTSNQLTIVGGDGKLDMFHQLLDLGRELGNRPAFTLKVHLEDEYQPPLETRLTGIRAESRNGESWTIDGTILIGSRSLVNAFGFGAVFPNGRFMAFYDTKRRQGSLCAPRD